MNTSIHQSAPGSGQDDDKSDLAAGFDILFENRWLILSIAIVVALFGAAYAYIAKPVYEANIVIQVEDNFSANPNSSKNILGDLSSMFEVKPAASAEMEVLRTRAVIDRAVENLRLPISAHPKYFPVIGAWLASRDKGLSEPGLFGYGGYAWGAEKIAVSTFNVPDALEGSDFILIAGRDGRYVLEQRQHNIELRGKVGSTINATTDDGNFELRVESINAKPGTQFILNRASTAATINNLQRTLSISEIGKQSGVIKVTLEGVNRQLTTNILNEIGREYVRKNVDRKSEEAEKSLKFLDEQLPILKKQLEQSEAKYTALRSGQGTIDLGEEAKGVLQKSMTTQLKLQELQQQKQQLLASYMPDHPAVIAVDRQIEVLNRAVGNVKQQIKQLPNIEQDVLRMTRDVKINTELYSALLNTAQHLRLVREGKVGTVRLLDPAMVPKTPIRPNRPIVIALATMIGLFLGVIGAFIKNAFYRPIKDSHEIEKALGLTVYANISHSPQQEVLTEQIHGNGRQLSVLAQIAPKDMAVESLRRFRTALQFSMPSTKNNIVLITGSTPGVGKSFVSVNFAAVLAATGKKVLLIDADLRGGCINQYFGIEREQGLSELVMGTSTAEQAIRKDVIRNVDFIPTGGLPSNPSELLSHADMEALLLSLSSGYDYVLMDSPPVLAVSDTIIIGRYAGVIFLTTRAGVSTLDEIKESINGFSLSGITVKGVIFNGLRFRPGRYAYGSKYGKLRYTQFRNFHLFGWKPSVN